MSDGQWYLASCPFRLITPLTALLRDGWEPFGTDGGYVYLRSCRVERPRVLIGFPEVSFAPWLP